MHDPYLPLPDGVRLDGSWLMVSGEVNVARIAGMVSDAA